MKITQEELNKLLKIIEELGITENIIEKLCKVENLNELDKIQYNYLLYILCLKNDKKIGGLYE